MPRFIIEHLEPFLSEWCLIEYENISKYIGKENLIITNLPKKDHKKLTGLAELHKESVLTMPLKKACLLEPRTNKILTPEDNFEYFIFGGILGDHPERGRTKKYLTSKLQNSKLINPQTRNLEKKQMSTDTAVLVTKMIAKDKIPFSKIDFIDEPTIKLKEGNIKEEIILPYRYVKENNIMKIKNFQCAKNSKKFLSKPKIAPKLLKYLKNKEDL